MIERHYGLCVGDTVEERAFGSVIRGIVFELPWDNNAAYIITADCDVIKVVAEWCVKIEPPIKLTYLCDTRRHLICVPFSIENLHRMADDLGIKRGWFDAGWRRVGGRMIKDLSHPHYDIPKRRIKEITAKCTVIPTRVLLDVIQGLPYETAAEAYATRTKATSRAIAAQHRGGSASLPDVDKRDRSTDKR